MSLTNNCYGIFSTMKEGSMLAPLYEMHVAGGHMRCWSLGNKWKCPQPLLANVIFN